MKPPNLSKKQYDLVIGVYTGMAWIEVAVPRGKGTMEEVELARKLLSDYEQFLEVKPDKEAT